MDPGGRKGPTIWKKHNLECALCIYLLLLSCTEKLTRGAGKTKSFPEFQKQMDKFHTKKDKHQVHEARKPRRQEVSPWACPVVKGLPKYILLDAAGERGNEELLKTLKNLKISFEHQPAVTKPTQPCFVPHRRDSPISQNINCAL